MKDYFRQGGPFVIGYSCTGPLATLILFTHCNPDLGQKHETVETRNFKNRK